MKKKTIIILAVILILLFGVIVLGLALTGKNDSHKGTSKEAEAEQSANASDEKENAVQKEQLPGTLLDCDTLAGFTVKSQNGDVEITDAEGEYKEGAGAYRCTGSNTVWWEIAMDNPVDISSYSEDGIHLWLYIDDPAQLTTNATIEVGNAKKDGTVKLRWIVRKEKLTVGWNDCCLKFVNATKVQDESVDLTQVDYLRVYGALKGLTTVMLDDVRAVETESQKIVLWNCDKATGVEVNCSVNQYQFTNQADTFKEGNAAIQVVGEETHRCAAVFAQTIDISACEDGVLHLWLYVDDVSKIEETVAVELGSAGQYDKCEYQWSVEKEKLTSGWNELTLPLLHASESQDAGIDLSKINWFRVYMHANGKRTVIIDDVYVTN